MDTRDYLKALFEILTERIGVSGFTPRGVSQVLGFEGSWFRQKRRTGDIRVGDLHRILALLRVEPVSFCTAVRRRAGAGYPVLEIITQMPDAGQEVVSEGFAD